MSMSGLFHRRPLSLGAALPLAAALLTGCASYEDGDEPLGWSEDEVVVCAGPTTVQGIDVSYYQGSIDWKKVKASGREFAIARVSDAFFEDSKFAANWSGMKAAGLIRGAYQFFRSDEDASAQADLMIEKVGVLGPDDLPCTIDVESTDGQSAATITAKIHTWVNKVEAATGKKPIIYTGKYFWNDNVKTADFKDHPLWIAAYGPPCPDTPTVWSTWKMWQYSSTGSVPGISGNVDLNEFNGSLADLQTLANGGADWGAKYVSQSFPLATMPLVLTVNQSVPAYMELKNIGKKSWDENTRLATTEPRDRESVFAAPDWIAPNRLANVQGTVATGETYKFNFTFRAPNKPGTYFEYFGMVQEGVAWFSDPGQAGPKDNLYQAQIQVVEAEYHGEVVKQSFPTLAEPAIELAVGNTLEGYVDVKNVGTATWKAGATKLAPTPRDEESPLGAPSWLSKTRVSTLDTDVPPGEVGHFRLDLTGNEVGDFTQTFALIEEDVTWFSDAPKGGGPADDFIALRVIVGDGSANGSGGGSGTASGGAAAPNGSADATCSCRAAPSPDAPGLWLGVTALGAAMVCRRLGRGRARREA